MSIEQEIQEAVRVIRARLRAREAWVAKGCSDEGKEAQELDALIDKEENIPVSIYRIAVARIEGA